VGWVVNGVSVVVVDVRLGPVMVIVTALEVLAASFVSPP
jgi:hypothetical protein